jgi:hypothetical protein
MSLLIAHTVVNVPITPAASWMSEFNMISRCAPLYSSVRLTKSCVRRALLSQAYSINRSMKFEIARTGASERPSQAAAQTEGATLPRMYNPGPQELANGDHNAQKAQQHYHCHEEAHESGD